MPDVELDELATVLREDSGIVVSLPTIHRELARHGLTRKKVCAPVDMTCMPARHPTDHKACPRER